MIGEYKWKTRKFVQSLNAIELLMHIVNVIFSILFSAKITLIHICWIKQSDTLLLFILPLLVLQKSKGSKE